MNYQPYLGMNVLISDALLATIPPMLTVLLTLIGVFLVFYALHLWLNKS